MNAKDYFKPKEIAQLSIAALSQGKEDIIVFNSNGSCQLTVKPKDYGVYITAFDRLTGLDCLDENEFESEVEEIYLQLIKR